uniref:Lysophospholipid acyltransferase LPEAT2-like n=1 Tax=Rhizophora mucronata TaxID=61149 RepID=A0A2P2L0J5_RHIMU
MTEPGLSSPLLTSQPSDDSQIILAVHDDSGTQSFSAEPRNRHNHIDNHALPHLDNDSDSNTCRNPFEFIGSEELSVPPPCTLDPFVNSTPEVDGAYEVIKILLCLPLAAVRLVLFGLSLLIGFVATLIALKGWKDKHNPMPKWRSRLMWITRACARCILFSFGYQWIKRKGKPVPKEIAPIVVSNHVSYIEPIFYFYELFPTIVAAESHDSIPFVGTIVRAMQVIYVDRFSPSSRKNAVNEIKRKASCDKFPRVLLFPEGTTTNGRALASFQLGAFIPGCPVQPVVVRYPHVHFDQSWGNISLGKLMFRMFTQFHNFMEIEYLPIVSPLDCNKDDPAEFAQRTSNAMATCLNVVQTFHSYGDVMLLVRASQSKQEKPSRFTVEMARVKSLFHTSSGEAVDFLDKFLSMNPDSSGRVKFHNFMRGMKLRACSLSEEVFGFIDVEKIGSITFKQFLYGSSYVMNLPVFLQACQVAFTECDTEQDNQISEQEVCCSFLALFWLILPSD